MPDISYLQIVRAQSADTAALVTASEAAYRTAVDATVSRVIGDPACRVILLAGPSSSGKTTTARILCETIAAAGHPAFSLSLDDFYRPPDDPDYPLHSDGTPDYESPASLRISEIHDCLAAVLSGESYDVPRFDFMQGGRAPERHKLSVPSDGYLVVEGLHALNPLLTVGLAREKIAKIFISVSTNILDENGARLLSGRKIRLLRRMTRDALYRASDAARTYALWRHVLRGEEQHLYPLRDTADIKIDTFHPYEIGVFRPHAERLLAAEGAPHDAYIDVLRAALGRFAPLPTACVPKNSLLREFLPLD